MDNEALGRLLEAWPGVTSDIKWEHDRVWSVGGKMFCARAEAAGPEAPLSFKVQPERFLELTAQPAFEPAPYLARASWVLARPDRVPGEVLAAMLRTSYELVRAKLPKKLQREFAD
ncbi:MmcQ/YjbR family DNA-binding protein [Lysobacter humi (ex Lee et al. 2017)]